MALAVSRRLLTQKARFRFQCNLFWDLW